MREKNPFWRGRFYFLPLYSSPLDQNSLWEVVSGGLRETNICDLGFERSLEKAVSAGYSGLIFPNNSILHDKYEHLVSRCIEAGLQPIQQVTSSMLNRFWSTQQELCDRLGVGLELILEDIPSDEALVGRLSQRRAGFHVTVPGLKTLPIWKEIDGWPSKYFDNTYFYFPYQAPGGREHIFTPRQIMSLYKNFQNKKREALWKSPLGVDIFEQRVESRRELEPSYNPVFSVNQVQSPLVSVVIPAYNNGKYLVNTLKHLEAQSLGHENFEVVVVDDGSSDDTSELVLSMKDQFKMAWTYIYFPRSSPRKMGDSQFRAGIARNLGVKFAKGEILAFLDSDIITPPTYLRTIVDRHKDYDVVQWRRDYLSKKVKSTEITYAHVDADKDCFVPEDGYWHQFYTDAGKEGWRHLPDYWKYTCTYGLSLPKKMFLDIGWFRKTYCFYGFEDTDLGWRLYRSGARFHFHNEPVYHLYHPTERSEFGNSVFNRHRLLRHTARIFFNNNPSPEIYNVFKNFLRQGLFP